MKTREKFTFVPFFFDGNLFFGEVNTITDWLELCCAYRGEFSRRSERGGSEKENRTRLMSRATATRTTEDIVERGYSFPKWYKLPNFGLRSEHIGQSLTLEAWLKKNSMYDLLLKAK